MTKYFQTPHGRRQLLNTIQAIIEFFMEPAEQRIGEIREKAANDNNP